ncbi:MAG: hypothetical protein FWG64_00100 [Firmicutes bacterium]|nr:hypothetical protein [Bacillota bacterium]
MKAEYTAEDFAKAKPNPYFHRLNTKAEVPLRHEVYAVYKKIADNLGTEPEIIMRRTLEMWAEELEKDD